MTSLNATVSMLPETELVERVRVRDTAAFAELVWRTRTISIRQAMLMLRNREEAEDELQNAYVKAWLHIEQFQGQSKFSTWFLRIVMNQCLMRLRQRRPHSFLYLDSGLKDPHGRPHSLVDDNPSPEHSCDHDQQSDMLQREIGRLPPILRHVLVLRDLQELTTAEAAKLLRISTSAVKSRLLRARCELRTRLRSTCCATS